MRSRYLHRVFIRLAVLCFVILQFQQKSPTPSRLDMGTKVRPTSSSTNSSSSSSSTEAQPFVPWKSRRTEPIPCIIEPKKTKETIFQSYETQGKATEDGLLYIKIEKSASTTLASIAIRTAIAIAEKTQANNTREDGTLAPRVCKFRGTSHLWSKRSRPFELRDRGQGFLWKFLKNPTKVHLSIYLFFMVDWKDEEFGEESFLEYFNHTFFFGGFNRFFLSESVSRKATKELKEISKSSDDHVQEFARNLTNNLDFIGIVERMDESLVLLSIMLDLEVTDVLYSNAKVSGNWMRKSGKGPCRKIGEPRPLLPAMQNFLDSKYWSDKIKLDNALYDAVNKRLDATIDLVGRDVFDAKMEEFLKAKQRVTEYCSGKIVVECTAEGVVTATKERTKCYVGDIGCGFECLYELYPVVLNKDNKSTPFP